VCPPGKPPRATPEDVGTKGVNFYDFVGTGRILVVDDDEAIRELLSMRLGVLGYTVQVAKDGAAALDRINDFKPDAMIVDISMPRLDGFGFLERLGVERVRQIPTLMLTARHAQADVRRAVELGARDFLAKPFDEHQLFRRVARLMRKPRDVMYLAA
jgi:DNA-binding response OmpR family regulator